METIQTQEKNKEIVLNLYEGVLNMGKLELLNTIFSEEYNGFSGPLGVKGVAGFTMTVKGLIAAFPDIKWTIEDLFAEGDKVALKWTWKGINSGEYRGLPPTQKEFTNSGIGIYQVSEGKIINGWLETDRLGFLQQRGLVAQDLFPAPPKK